MDSKGSPKVSVIVPVKDMAESLEACLEALLHQKFVIYNQEYEVIVVDDGSGDSSAEVAKRAGVRVHQQENMGPAAARNAGARLAGGPILAFTDADCVPDEQWVANIIQAFSNPEVVGIKGTYRTQQKEVVARFVQQEYAYKYARMAHLDRIDFIDTYSAAYRKDIFLQNNGFDERFPKSSVEDQEFSFRLAVKGYRLEFHPELVVWHVHDKSIREYFQRKYKIGYWKTELLRSLPQKTLSDSHTPASQRWQIFLAGLIIVLVGLGMAWSPGFCLLLVSFLLFIGSGLPLMFWIAKSEPGIVWAVPGLLLVRAYAQGFGLIVGLFYISTKPKKKFQNLNFANQFLKRFFDILGAMAGLLISFPIILLSIIAIKLDDGGPAFFSQTRIGENGRRFRLYKLRTMMIGSEQLVQQLLPMNRIKGPAYKIEDDPRVTRIGRFFRRWSLDELPQFWNVLKGEMSIVGPRPEEDWVVEQYNDYQRQRLLVKPGMTGPMQIHGRGSLDFDTRLELELDYISKYSLWLDIEIIIKTIPVVIKGYGAF
jgi:lipopolysaccharide/colanic/teichoic acid biosynthesis glycosyltransferase/GT2 family glycosyltransferase